MQRSVGRPRVHDDERLLDAARSVFARDGFRIASMDAIAATAKTTKATLYARFGSKESLYERTVQRDVDALLEHIFATYSNVSDLPVSEMVSPAMRAYFDYFAARPDAFPMLFAPDRSEVARATGERVHDAITVRLTGLVEGVLSRSGRRAPAAARLIAAMLIGTAHYALREARRGGVNDEHARELATGFAHAALVGIDPQLIGPAR